MRNVGKITLDWLDRHGIEFDEIYFGKPSAELYLDDRALRCQDWAGITPELLRENAKAK